MSGNVTLGTLIDEAQDRADMKGNNLVTPTQWVSYINKSKDSLYDLLISAYGADYYVANPVTITMIPNTDKYALPVDYYKTMKVEYVVDALNFYPLKRFSPSTSNRSSRLYPSSSAQYNYTYRELGDFLYFYPIPTSGDNVRLWYVPLATNLVDNADALKGFNGWEEYIIIDVAIKALRKEESDTSDHERDLARLTKRLEEMAETRNIGDAHKILDVSRSINSDDYAGSVYYY